MVEIRTAWEDCLEWATDVPHRGGIMYTRPSDPREALVAEVVLEVFQPGTHPELIVASTDEATDGAAIYDAFHDPVIAAKMIQDGLYRLRCDELL